MALRPLNLSQQAMSVGLLPPSQVAALAPVQRSPRQAIAEGSPRSGAIGDALDNTPQMQGGSLAEALALGGEAFFRARSARDDRSREMNEALREEQRGYNRESALSNALANYYPSDPETSQRAMIAALANDAPDVALPMATAQIGQAQEREGRRADYMFEQDDADRRAPMRGQTETSIAVDRARQLAPIQIGVSRAGAGANRSFRVLTPGEVNAQGLPPGSYQMNESTGQIMPIGRVRGQYTEFAGQSAQFASRMTAADATLRELETVTDPVGVWGAMSGGGTTEQRRVRQAQREFVNSILRRESGAVIADSEFQSAAQQYFPQPGDPPEVIEQKRQARQRSIQGLVNTSQGAYDEWYGEGSGVDDPTKDQRQGYVSDAAPAGDVIRYERGPDGRPRRAQ